MPEPQVAITTSRHLPAWMAELKVSIAFTSKSSDKLFLIGVQPDGHLSIFERTFSQCHGLCSDGQTLWMSSLFQLWRFENVLQPGQLANGFDKLFAPQVGYTTGDVGIEDIAVSSNGKAIFVSSQFNCLTRTDERFSMIPVWKPPFISELADGNRCYLSGVATQEGIHRYVTCFGRSDQVGGWREQIEHGGYVIDISSNEIVAEGLSMPNSPRIYRGKLWLCDSGSGEFGWVDLESGKFEPITFLSGYMRGLDFAGNCAVIGLSKPSEKLPCAELERKLESKKAQARCGIQIVDLESCDVVRWIRIEGLVSEIGNVAVLPDTICPKAIGFQSDEICRAISLGEA